MSQSQIIAGSLLVAGFVFALFRSQSGQKRGRLPPGPKPSWFLGNLGDIPKELPWVVYRDWGLLYGDIIGLQLPGNQTMIVLNSPTAAYELLDKRSNIYSDRPKSLIVELMGWSWNTPLVPYGEEWRRTRRASSQHFTPKAMLDHLPVLEEESRRLLRIVRADPDRLRELLEFSFAATTLKTMYGIEIPSDDTTYSPLLHAALEGPTEGLMAGSFLVEHIPILQYVPAWIPGAGFQRKFAKWRKLVDEMLNMPFNVAKEAWLKGEGYHSATHQMLDHISQSNLTSEETADEERVAKIGAANVYAAGSDTTFSTLLSFYMAMALHPEVQVKAQAELDAVIGLDRLPEFTDRAKLPYINAVVKEALRWQNIVPLGVVHRSTEDDEYEGYFIPQGSLVFANIWAMMHNPKEYPDPERFKPERYLKDGALNRDAPDPADIVFGFGRRVCLGKNLADAALFINIACALHVFRITPPLEADGTPKNVKVKVSTGFLSYPSGFTCVIKARSPGAEALIRESQT
ncbi:cytochrome P450 [Epithele typhae]|uniref:cytochrome P450 n=1 Tax=Epithele typhae TaxID=378194 RepID=UPI00200772BA|nr:cytochrome P450 [Epithele typhae]KAH9929491.1 cytochrome P450 [Epithele typhae]